MLEFNHWGTIIRELPEQNYRAVWNNLKTYRVGKKHPDELPPEYSEFYDIGISDRCTTGNCPFCYVAANKNGRHYSNLCETWKNWMKHYTTSETKKGITKTNRPFQVAAGSTGEPTEHPEFPALIRTIYESGVVPNYTTNGVILAELHNQDSIWFEQAQKIMEMTRRFVGGVAVSFGNPNIREKAEQALNYLIQEGNTNVNIHHIVSDVNSVDDIMKVIQKYNTQIKYHVLLPMMPAGRSTNKVQPEAFNYLIEQLLKYEVKNVAFGAHFYEQLLNIENKLKTWIYPPESMSKNMILGDNKVIITPSSFNLTPIYQVQF